MEKITGTTTRATRHENQERKNFLNEVYTKGYSAGLGAVITLDDISREQKRVLGELESLRPVLRGDKTTSAYALAEEKAVELLGFIRGMAVIEHTIKEGHKR